MRTRVIYVPGLGDNKPRGQKLITKLWRIFGVVGVYEPMHWADKQPFALKLERLLARIDRLTSEGHKVSLIGTSAGASAVLTAFSQRKSNVLRVVCICGKINNPQTIDRGVYTTNPAFEESMHAVQQALPKLSPEDRARIMSIHPLRDDSVPVPDTIIPGGVEKTIPTAGHVFSIFCTLTVGAYGIMRFAKRRN